MDKFDRAAQQQLLQLLYDAYPNELTSLQMKDIDSCFPDQENRDANLLYLEQHKLIRSGLKPDAVGYSLVNRPSITRDGIDFIREDGGLGAILNGTDGKVS
ncbi:hypothetical protein D3C76_1095280 [compost metagenome]